MARVPSNCTSIPRGVHSPAEYEGPAYSPCGKFVAHPSNESCNTIDIADTITPNSDPHICQCRSEKCACGDFISHKIDVVCPTLTASWVGLSV